MGCLLEAIMERDNKIASGANRWRYLRENEGLALITSLAFMLIVALLGAVAVSVTTYNSRFVGRMKSNQMTFYSAEAGLEYAKLKLIGQLLSGLSPTQILASYKNTSTNLLLDSSDSAAILGATANSLFPKYVYNSSFSGGSYNVYLSNDVIDGVTTTTDTNNTLTLTSIGYGYYNTVAVVKSTYVFSTDVISSLAAVSMLGTGVNFDFGNSAAESIIGNATISAIAASTASGLAGITPPANATVNGNGTTQAQVRPPSSPFDTPQHLQTYYSQLKAAASSVGNYYNGNNPIIPSLNNPHNKPIVVNGNYTLSSIGSGIMVVTGTLTIDNNVNWDGLILVIGTGNLQRGDNGNINGAVMVGNIVGNIDTGVGITGAWGISTLGGTSGRGHFHLEV